MVQVSRMAGGQVRAKTYSPEVVDKEVEDAENNDEESGAELGLEADDDHDAGASTQDADDDAPDGPGTAEDEADKQENQEDATSELEVHLAVLLVDLGQTGKGLGLTDPRVGEDHDEATNDGQVAEEEVEVEDEAVSEGLGDDNGHEAGDGIVGVLADDDEGGAGKHGNDVDEKEKMGEATRNWRRGLLANVGGRRAARCAIEPRRETKDWLTATVVAEVDELVAPLGHDAEGIFQEGDDDEEAADGGKVAVLGKLVSDVAREYLFCFDTGHN